MMRWTAFIPIVFVATILAFHASRGTLSASTTVRSADPRVREIRLLGAHLRALFVEIEAKHQSILPVAEDDARRRLLSAGTPPDRLDAAVAADPALLRVRRLGALSMQLAVGGGQVVRELDLVADRLEASIPAGKIDAEWRTRSVRLAELEPKVTEFIGHVDRATDDLSLERLAWSRRTAELLDRLKIYAFGAALGDGK